MDIVTKAVSKTYREQDGPVIGDTDGQGLDGIDLTVPAGSFLALMGPSGSGKSTLLNMLAGIVRPTSGRVLYDGRDIWALSDSRRSRLRAASTATVFQEYNLFDYLTVRENIALGTRLAHAPAERHAVRDALTTVGMEPYANTRPDELSGGQRQRVAIARAVASDPQVIFADEPTGALDEANGRAVVRLLRELADAGTSVLMVTHEPEIAAAADRTLMLRDGMVDHG
jgi:putative ABC transport system ATP-binding protein